MVKTRITIFAAMIITVMLVLGAVPGSANKADVMIILQGPSSNLSVKTVFTDIKGPGICRTMNQPYCDGREFRWELVNPAKLPEGGCVKVRAVLPVTTLDCFSGQYEWVIYQSPFYVDSSVPANSTTCPLNAMTKYGVLWPYDVEVWESCPDGVPEGEEPIAVTDPRGILH